jgi:predicted AAA+ superfamily ATPase
MKYIQRNLERKFLHMSEFSPAVLVTGARQVGKTTMLKHLAEGTNRTYVSLDNSMARILAKEDPVLFFQTYKPPIIIDEIQNATELFPQIKIICDNSEETGLFWLTGSQGYKMMKGVRETLAGRITILTLFSLSNAEKNNTKWDDEIRDNPLDFSRECLLNRQSKANKTDVEKVFENIWQGGMPKAVLADNEQRQEYFNSYVNTFLMRDVADLGGITETIRFAKFVTACAALVAQQVNYATIAETANISQPTAREWLRLLEGLGVIYLLQPYSNNALKRLTKTPKLYFCDTGLAAFLSMWLTPQTLLNGAANGFFFENYVVMELLKNYSYSKSKVNLTYFRDSNAKEIDIFIEENNVIHPIEIKKSANPNRSEVKKFIILEKSSVECGNGGIICMCEELIPIDDKNFFIPCELI